MKTYWSHKNNKTSHKCLMFLSSLCAWFSFLFILTILLFYVALLHLVMRDTERRRHLFLKSLHRNALIPIHFIKGLRMQTENPNKENFQKQAIIICNHQSILDLLMIIATIPNLSILIKKEFKQNYIFRLFAKFAGYHFASDDYINLFRSIEKDIKQGYHLLVFPEGTRTDNGDIGTFHSGAFSIARYFNIDILPLYISGTYEVLPKYRYVIAKSESQICLQIQPRIDQHFLHTSVKKMTQQMHSMYCQLHKKRQSVCVIGGGMGGLFIGALLAQNNYRVIVLEKNHIIGGGLQSFHRGEAVFNTGLHNFGGFEDKWALSQILNYLNIKKELNVMPVDADAQEIVHTSTQHCYYLPKGRKQFEEYLVGMFPEQAQGINQYIEILHQIANSFDHYMMRRPMPHPEVNDYINLTAEQLIRLFITDEELILVLSYITPMCGHPIQNIPVSIFSMLSVLYISGEYRFVDNTLQLAEELATSIQMNGGMVLADTEVCSMNIQDENVFSVTTADNRIFTAEVFVGAIPPKELLSFTNASIVRKVARNRIDAFATEISTMSIFIDLKEKSFPFINSTIFLPNMQDDRDMPNYILMTTPPVSEQNEWAHTIEILSPVYYKDFRRWENTKLMNRGEEYEQYKQDIANEVITYISQYYPSLSSAVKSMYVASPLTIRDYYNNPCGALFSQQGLYLPLRTRIKNLFLTGQSVLYHGLCGVPLTAILTAEALSGKDILTDIVNAKEE